VKDPYAVLGVSRTASDAEIRFAYRQAVRSLRAGEGGEGEPRLDEVEEAFKILSDPRRRRAVDGARVEPSADAGESAEPAVTPVAPLAEAENVPRNPLTRLTRRLPRPWRIVLDWVLTIAGAVLIVLAIKQWAVNPYRIPSSSMEPRLHCARGQGPQHDGCEAGYSDRVLANRFIYHLRDPHRGEIVVFETPAQAKLECGAGGTFVKRLIGLPGEKVREKEGRFFVNGKRLDDSSYVKPGRRDDRSGFWIVPKNSYFFVGDNRTRSCDSRRWGSVPRDNLIGLVFATYWPPNRIHVDTPGVVGGVILGAIGAFLALLAALAIRRRHVR
jgi:signal peptidase I